MIYEYINFNLESTLVCPYIRFYLPVLIRATLPPLWYSIYKYFTTVYTPYFFTFVLDIMLNLKSCAERVVCIRQLGRWCQLLLQETSIHLLSYWASKVLMRVETTTADFVSSQNGNTKK